MKFTAVLPKYGLCFGFLLLLCLLFQFPAGAEVVSTKAPSTATASRQQIKTVVYYFHGNMRCSSCKKIEAYTREAIQSGFADALKNGSLELKVINVEKPGHEHYVRDFQLYTRSVVVEVCAGEKRQEWKNLDKVWLLIRDKSAFMQYVQEQTRVMMKRS